MGFSAKLEVGNISASYFSDVLVVHYAENRGAGVVYEKNYK